MSAWRLPDLKAACAWFRSRRSASIKRIGYHAYEGITEDFDERERLNRDLGQNRAMIMHNHGLLTVGKSAREAFVLMKHLIDAADIQLKLEATGAEVIEIPPDGLRQDR